LRKVLYAAGSILREGGRLVVISFHSLEDRIVKRFIQGKDYQTSNFSFQKVGKNFIRPNKEEIKLNPRSRSAILRTAERVT
jgi:16S rRNA (cytosine1402-N4)-methyltransferase